MRDSEWFKERSIGRGYKLSKRLHVNSERNGQRVFSLEEGETDRTENFSEAQVENLIVPL